MTMRAGSTRGRSAARGSAALAARAEGLRAEIRKHDEHYYVKHRPPIVVKSDWLDARARFGATSHHPRWALPYKFAPRSETTIVDDVVFQVTGTLPTLGRIEATRLAEDAGAHVTDAVSKRLDYLVAGRSAGKKLSRARRVGVPVIDERACRQLISESNGRASRRRARLA
jgi:NAD-dependent DNA ligase